MPRLNLRKSTWNIKHRLRSYAASGLGITDRILPAPIIAWSLKKVFNLQLVCHSQRDSKAIEPVRFQDNAKGALCLTIDWDLPSNVAGQRALPASATNQVSTATTTLLHLASAYHFPVTIAVCGEHAKKVPGALDQILGSKQQNEIASHTFSHMDLSGPTASREATIEDLNRNAVALSTIPRSFVFPWNREGQKDVLKEAGFICYRGGAHDILGYADWDEGIWNIPKTHYLKGDDAHYERSILRRLVDLAIHRECLLHIWTHPWNLQTNGESADFVHGFMDQFFRYVALKREEGLLWVGTMGQIANYCEALRNTRISATTTRTDELRAVAECRVSSPPYDPVPKVTLKASLPARASKVEVISNGVPTHSFNASWRKFKTVHFSEAFVTPRKEIQIQFS